MSESAHFPVVQPKDAVLPPPAEDRLAVGEKIAQGMASARAGRLADGPAVFARHFAELGKLEADAIG